MEQFYQIIEQISRILQNVQYDNGNSIEVQIQLPLEILNEIPIEELKKVYEYFYLYYNEKKQNKQSFQLLQTNLLMILMKFIEILNHFDKITIGIYNQCISIALKLIETMKNEYIVDTIPSIVKQLERIRTNGNTNQVIEAMEIIFMILFKGFSCVKEDHFSKIVTIINRWFIQIWRIDKKRFGDRIEQLVELFSNELQEKFNKNESSKTETSESNELNKNDEIISVDKRNTSNPIQLIQNCYNQLKEISIKCDGKKIQQRNEKEKQQFIERSISELLSIATQSLNWLTEKERKKKYGIDETSDIRSEGRERLNELISIIQHDEMIETSLLIISKTIAAIEVVLFSENELNDKDQIEQFPKHIEHRIIEELLSFHNQSERIIGVLNGRHENEIFVKKKGELDLKLEQRVVSLLISKGKKCEIEIVDKIIEVLLNEHKKEIIQLLQMKETIDEQMIIDVLLQFHDINEMKDILLKFKGKYSIEKCIDLILSTQWNDLNELQLCILFVTFINSISDNQFEILYGKIHLLISIMIDNDDWLLHLFSLIKLLFKKISKSYHFNIHEHQRIDPSTTLNSIEYQGNVLSYLHILGMNKEQQEVQQRIKEYKQKEKEERMKIRERNDFMNSIIKNCCIGLTHSNENIKNEAMSIIQMNLHFIKTNEIMKIIEIINFYIENEIEEECVSKQYTIVQCISLINSIILMYPNEFHTLFEKKIQRNIKLLFDHFIYKESTFYNEIRTIKKQLFQLIGNIFDFIKVKYDVGYNIGLSLLSFVSCKRFFQMKTVEQKEIVDEIVCIFDKMKSKNCDIYLSLSIPLKLSNDKSKIFLNDKYKERYSHLYDTLFHNDYVENTYLISHFDS